MVHCVNHDSMHLPYPALLTKLFRYFDILTNSDVSETIIDSFDLKVLTANKFKIVDNSLVFNQASKPVSSTHAASSHVSFESSSYFIALSKQVEDNSKLLQTVNSKLDSVLTLLQSSASRIDSVDTQLLFLKSLYSKLSSTTNLEFGNMQDGLFHAAKAWEKKFVKLFYILSSETKFVSKQVSTIVHKKDLQWHSRDWMDDSTLAEITIPLPLPAIPPPQALGLTPDEYHAKIFEWLSARDGKPPPDNFYLTMFTEYGQPYVVPPTVTRKGNAKHTPVDVDD
ncbi:hypothetical protein POM88_011437 [Heracleum sosnowskyi]|uniref:Uncharacterized protein n=1 Tax=Heracleum sosnowskyi TaxID=360622 RepID=A0AAD8IX09_9APIA|nr:hypothetical protein POM88_011437 [Heracleum sosnowskyi]